jgi:hypothetical protein
MGETITIRTGAATEVIKVIEQGPQGPAGPTGTGLETLTTQGDLLYRGASTGQRLPIGTSGQVLKVANGIPAWGNESGAVTSVNGETGAVSLSAADVGAAAAAHTHDGTQVEIVADDATGPVLAAGFSEGSGVNGIYWPTDTTANALLVYKLNRTYGMFFEAGRWHIYELAPLSANIVVSSDLDDTDYPHQSNWPTGSVTKASLSNFGDNAAQQFRFVGDSMAVTDVTNAVSTSDSRLTDSRDPNLHAASHLVGTPAIAASYTGIGDSETFSEEVTITANTAGTAGNSITLAFDGVDDVDTVLAAWNSANSSNQATLDSGDGGQVPDDGDSLTLSGGVAAIAGGSDPVFDQDLNTTNSPTFEELTISNGGTYSIKSNGTSVAGGGAEFEIATSAGNPIMASTAAGVVIFGGSEAFFGFADRAAPSDTTIQGGFYKDSGVVNFWSQPNQQNIVSVSDNGDVLIGNTGYGTVTGTSSTSSWGKKFQVNGNITIRDNTGDETATFDAQAKLTANRTYDLPDANGTLALTSDIPTTASDIGAAASGSITTSGLTQATARILGRTSSSTGAVEEIQIGSGLSLSAGELSATGGSGGGEVRSDFVSPYTYTGLADAGTSESTASWLIRRSEFDAGGSFVATLTASAVEWDDRLTASYA